MASAGLWRWLKSVNDATDGMPEPAIYVEMKVDRVGVKRMERKAGAVEVKKFELG